MTAAAGPQTLHAGLIARRIGGDWRGVLVRGPSGSGKSSLALRAVADGFALVADDRVIVWRSGGAVFGRAPDVLSALLEVRGLGVGLFAPALRLCRVALVVDLVANANEVERTPEPETVPILGLALPRIWLAPFEASATHVLTAALAAVQRPL